MKLWVDSANAEDIRSGLLRGCSGVTTNPSLLRREGGSPIPMLKAIVSEIEWSSVPLSVELWATGRDAILEQARWIVGELQYDHLVFKLPMTWGESVMFRTLPCVNATAIMSYAQAIVAANAGARYVSLFWGRISDIGSDAATVVHQVRETFDRDGCESEIIVGSVRAVRDVAEAMQAGAHIVTVPPPILYQMCQHPKTDEIVAQFARDAS